MRSYRDPRDRRALPVWRRGKYSGALRCSSNAKFVAEGHAGSYGDSSFAFHGHLDLRHAAFDWRVNRRFAARVHFAEAYDCAIGNSIAAAVAHGIGLNFDELAFAGCPDL